MDWRAEVRQAEKIIDPVSVGGGRTGESLGVGSRRELVILPTGGVSGLRCK